MKASVWLLLWPLCMQDSVPAQEWSLIDAPSFPHGVTLQSENARHVVHAGGVFVLDARLFDQSNSQDSDFRLDRAVLRFEGRHQDIGEWRVAADLHGVDTRYGFEEAWFAAQLDGEDRLTLGLQPIPLGAEATLPEEDSPIAGLNFATQIDRRTDFALRYEREFGDGRVTLDAAAAAGFGFDNLGDPRKGPQWSARVVTYPLWSGSEPQPAWYEGVFAGAAFAYTHSFRGHIDVVTPMRNKLFVTDEFRADAAVFLHIHFGMDAGPVRVAYETLRGEGSAPAGSGFLDITTPAGEREDFDQVGSWSLVASWLLTGERYDSRPFHSRRTRGHSGEFPLRPLHSSARGIGAVELALRYDNADLDRKFFTTGFTDEQTSSQEFRNFIAAVNWWPNSGVRLTAEIVRVIADQQPRALEGGNRDTSGLLRIQLRF